MAYLLFHVFNQLIYVANFCIYVHRGYWSIVFGGCIFEFVIKVMLASQKQFGRISPWIQHLGIVLGEFQMYNI